MMKYHYFLIVRIVLAECRASCRKLYQDTAEEDLPEMIKIYGGNSLF